MVSKFQLYFLSFRNKHACDGQTDRQNYDPQDRASIAASRGKNNNIADDTGNRTEQIHLHGTNT